MTLFAYILPTENEVAYVYIAVRKCFLVGGCRAWFERDLCRRQELRQDLTALPHAVHDQDERAHDARTAGPRGRTNHVGQHVDRRCTEL